jgi:cell division inhibitor SulA
MPASPALDPLLQGPHLWRGDRCAEVAIPSLPTGHPALDALLPGAGWPRGALTELRLAHTGIGELTLLLPALREVVREGRRVALISPPHVPYACAFAQAGLDPTRLLVVQAHDSADALWAMEQALASGVCGAVVGWPAFVTERSLRRLQLAAETGRACSVHCLTGAITGSSLAALRLELLAPRDLAPAGAGPERDSDRLASSNPIERTAAQRFASPVSPGSQPHLGRSMQPALRPVLTPTACDTGSPPQSTAPPSTGLLPPRRLVIRLLKVRGPGLGRTLPLDLACPPTVSPAVLRDARPSTDRAPGAMATPSSPTMPLPPGLRATALPSVRRARRAMQPGDPSTPDALAAGRVPVPVVTAAGGAGDATPLPGDGVHGVAPRRRA